MARRDESGFSLVELLAATSLIALGLLGLLATFPAVVTLSRSAREAEVATSAARSMLDRMRAAGFPDPADPDGPNVLTTYRNATFTAAGLAGSQGAVSFLTEAEASAAFGGIPLDLDLDGASDTTATANARFCAFPVRIEMRWTEDGPPAAGGRSVRGVTLTTAIYDVNH